MKKEEHKTKIPIQNSVCKSPYAERKLFNLSYGVSEKSLYGAASAMFLKMRDRLMRLYFKGQRMQNFENGTSNMIRNSTAATSRNEDLVERVTNDEEQDGRSNGSKSTGCKEEQDGRSKDSKSTFTSNEEQDGRRKNTGSSEEEQDGRSKDSNSTFTREEEQDGRSKDSKSTFTSNEEQDGRRKNTGSSEEEQDGRSKDSNSTFTREEEQDGRSKDSESNVSASESGFADLAGSTYGGPEWETDVYVNGKLIPHHEVREAEKLAGPISPGSYWYDWHAGFWGAMGNRCLGIIPPFIYEFSFPMPVNCAGGTMDVYVNDRELNTRDLDLLASRGLPTTKHKFYVVEISGKVTDKETGKLVVNLGRLAPTVERVGHGFGMKAPRYHNDWAQQQG
ncbi:hypothetical protein Ancab_015415 [Ancistrocladus abbreviatus]